MLVSRSGLGWLVGAGLAIIGALVAGDAAAEKVAGQQQLHATALGQLAHRLAAASAGAEALADKDAAKDKPAAEDQPGGADGKGETEGTTRYLVAAMGDSLTDPKSHGGRYLKYLRAQCPESRFDSYGVGGNMVNQMRRRFNRDVYGEADPKKPGSRAKKRPAYTHVLVLGGINDICSDESANRSNKKITADLAKMYSMTRKHGAKVIALTMPPWAGFTRYYNRRRANSTFEVNDWIRQQHLDGTVDGLLDVYPIMSCGEPEFLCERLGWSDKVHWNKAGHKVVGQALHEQIFADCR